MMKKVILSMSFFMLVAVGFAQEPTTFSTSKADTDYMKKLKSPMTFEVYTDSIVTTSVVPGGKKTNKMMENYMNNANNMSLRTVYHVKEIKGDNPKIKEYKDEELDVTFKIDYSGKTPTVRMKVKDFDNDVYINTYQY